MQIFGQHTLASTLQVYAPGPTCEVRVCVATPVRYSVTTGTAPDPETITARTVATTLVDPTGTETTDVVFDSAYVWVVIIVAGTGTLRLVREADRDNIDTWLPANSQWVDACWIAGARPTLDRQQS